MTNFTRTVIASSLLSLLVGCGDDSSGGGGQGGGAPGGSCEPAIGCPEVPSECLAFVDNSGQTTFSLRITQLNVSKPAALTDPTVTNILSTGITYDYPQCTNDQNLPFFTKDGTFNWILTFDTGAGTLRTGGAALETDPTAGYCFLSGEIAGFNVEPLVTPITLNADGSFEVDGTADVVVPIFTDKTDTSKVILLPLRSVRIFDSTLSADNNCIGTFNGDELEPNNLCLADSDTPTFESGGQLEGYITLEEADEVLVPELSNASLCALIAGAEFVDQETNKCRRDANDAIEFQGDWCAGADETDPGTPATGTCFDAVQLAAGFAAAGAQLRSDCN